MGIEVPLKMGTDLRHMGISARLGRSHLRKHPSLENIEKCGRWAAKTLVFRPGMK